MTDLEPFLNEEFQMVAFDLVVGVISALILWKCCKINIIQQCCDLLHGYWAIICLQMGGQISAVSITQESKYMVENSGSFYI